MKPFIFTLCLSFATLHIIAQETNSSSTEPKFSFELKINGKTYLIKEGEEIMLDSVFKKPSVSIKISDYKKFDNTYLTFQYQRHLSFEYEEDDAYRSWTFSGNNIVVMLFEFDVEVPFDNFIDEMITRFGKENTSVTDFKKKLGGKDLTGKSLKVTVAGQKLELDLYKIELEEGKSSYIAFQNTLTENDGSTDEYKKVFETISSTIAFK